jgi:hypothetical protein
MLAEIAAANAAFAIIKTAIQNGSEIAKVGKSIADFTNARDAIQRKAAKHGSNLDGSKSDLEEFLALDELKRKEAELRSMMQLYGRAGMYDDYVRFCAEARRKRHEAQVAAQRKHDETIDFWLQVGLVGAVVCLGLFALWLFAMTLLEAQAHV